MDYRETIDYLFGLQRYGFRSSLDVMREISAALGSPDRGFQAVHVAGTNGKGSTGAILASILRAAGLRVGLYTSPHLIDFTERIQIDGRNISREEVCERADEVRRVIHPQRPPTFFEFTTAMAFLHFAARRVDLAILEVGMGGRLDATNLVTPAVGIITNVARDHEVFLGDSLKRIAGEKAGIIKEGVPLVTAAAAPEAVGVIEKICRDRRAPLTVLGREVWLDGCSPLNFDYHGQKWALRNLSCSMLGRHQILNAGVAIAAAERLGQAGVSLSESHVRQGLAQVRWPGRLEVIRKEPLILLDGAHNPAGAKALGDYLAELKQVRQGRLAVAVGILADKNLRGILGELAPVSDWMVLTRPDYAGAASLDDLQCALGAFSGRVDRFEQIPHAISFMRSRLLPQDIFCIAGSLYTVGAAKAFLEGRATPPVVRG